MQDVLAQIGSSDRAVRYAARVALEQSGTKDWDLEKVVNATPQTVLTATMALARTFDRESKGKAPNIDSPLPEWTADRSNESEDRKTFSREDS